MAPKYKLIYFQARAVAEPIRYLLSYGGVEFEDYRQPKESWPQLKPTLPFGQLPVLEVDGRILHQSLAIERYLAKQFKLVGSSDLENWEIDAVVDTINDFRQKVGAYHYETDKHIKEHLKGPLYNEVIPCYLDRLDAIAKKNSGHLALGKLTWADIFFAGILDYLNGMSGVDMTAKHANLRAVRDNVNANPKIKAWIEKRPKTDL